MAGQVSAIKYSNTSILLALWKQERKQNRQLREALEAVEWVHIQDYSDWIHEGIVCPWCYGFKEDGHKPDCQRQQALAAAEQPR